MGVGTCRTPDSAECGDKVWSHLGWVSVEPLASVGESSPGANYCVLSLGWCCWFPRPDEGTGNLEACLPSSPVYTKYPPHTTLYIPGSPHPQQQRCLCCDPHTPAETAPRGSLGQSLPCCLLLPPCSACQEIRLWKQQRMLAPHFESFGSLLEASANCSASAFRVW